MRRTKAAPSIPDTLEIEGLRRLAASLATPGRYDAAALRLIQRELFLWIGACQAFEQDLARWPQVHDVPLGQPLFIVGFGRTGSTLLHGLLALDPQARAPVLWELLAPSPATREADSVAPRIEQARRRLESFVAAEPGMLQIHPMAADAPDECHWMMRHSPLLATLYDVPEYWSWLKRLAPPELRLLYAGYRRQVQHLQLFARRGRWLGKAFSHLHFLPVLPDLFPDARIVRLHRHPGQAIPSLCSLVSIYRRVISGPTDPAAIGDLLLDMFVDGAERSMSFDMADPGRIIDVGYDALTADPIAGPLAVVQHIYDAFGWPLDAAVRQAMTGHLERQASVRRPRHVYDAEGFGLSRARILDRTGHYLGWAEARCGTLRA